MPFFILIVLFATNQKVFAQKNHTNAINKDTLGQVIYTVVEEMPRFPGCEGVEGEHAVKKQCADQKLLKYIYNNWQIPTSAREMQVCERIVISFIVDVQGKVKEVEVVEEPGYGIGASLAKVFRSMNELPQCWRAGRLHGKPVAVKYIFPMRYTLGL